MKKEKQLLEKKYGNSVFQTADEIFHMAKKGGTTKDQLLGKLPSGNILVDITGCIIDLAKNEIEEDKRASENYTRVLRTIIDTLNGIIKDKKVTSEERQEIASQLTELGKAISEVERARKEQQGKTARTIIIGVLTLGLAVIFRDKINFLKNNQA